MIGGLGSIAGPVIGALWVRGLPVVFNDTAQVRLFTSSIGLLILLMYFPGGLMQIVVQAPRRRARVGRSPPRATRGVEAPVPAIAKRVPTRGDAPTIDVAGVGCPWLAVRDVSVRFGGNQAVDHVEPRRAAPASSSG